MVLASFPIPTQNTMSAMEQKFVISANGKSMTATFADNSSADAFRELISEAPLTVDMSDYGGFEKVGSLGHTLPTNDVSITTEPGDVILYLGNNITIYYDVNTWSFTRLGKIDGNPTRESILSVLGKGNVNVTFSIKETYSEVTELDGVVGSSALDVDISGRMVEVNGIPENHILSIYNIDGKCVYQGLGRVMTLPASGIYLLTCGNAKTRIMVR